MTQPFEILDSVVDDNIVECVEKFTVKILSVSTCGVTIGSTLNNAEVRITDNDSK